MLAGGERGSLVDSGGVASVGGGVLAGTGSRASLDGGEPAVSVLDAGSVGFMMDGRVGRPVVIIGDLVGWFVTVVVPMIPVVISTS